MQSISHDGLTYRFEVIDIDGEEEWAKDVREQAMQESMEASDGWPESLRAKFLADVSTRTTLAKCGFNTDFGIENLKTNRGIAKILQLAARKHHPGATIEAMLAVVKAKELEASRVALTVIPISDESRQMLLGALDELEKKLSGQRAGRSSPPLNSAAPSAGNPGVSTPKLSVG